MSKRYGSRHWASSSLCLSVDIYQLRGVAGGFIFSGLDWGFDVFAGSGTVAGIRYQDTNLQVVNPFETPEYQQAVELRWKWGQKGYYKKDAVPPDQGAVAVQNGQYALLIGQQAKPNDIPGIEQHFGINMSLFC